jgi:hypothetical protein
MAILGFCFLDLLLAMDSIKAKDAAALGVIDSTFVIVGVELFANADDDG